jgi:hypothetical protein
LHQKLQIKMKRIFYTIYTLSIILKIFEIIKQKVTKMIITAICLHSLACYLKILVRNMSSFVFIYGYTNLNFTFPIRKLVARRIYAFDNVRQLYALEATLQNK